MIPQETIQEIIGAARIEEVVGDFVVLKKRGANLLGLCPFHNEKTPSFTVSPAKGIYKCFGCGKGGDSLSFIMDLEHYTYPEGLKYLANKYGIEIQEKEITSEDQSRLNDRDAMYAVSKFASDYFSHILFHNEMGRNIGLTYFQEREFTQDTIKKFQLGYCLDQWDAFSQAAQKASYSPKFLVQVGLSVDKDGKLFDRFRDRVMFPIHNLSGRVIGFGGRILQADKSKAKYVNSPESDIYSKSQVLYGLYFAKQSIVQKDQCLLVEGYTDVISLHQAGICNVVASSGTALTLEQIKLISRFTKNICILYDGDAAGIKASFRGIDMILEQGLNVKVLSFPNGEDPDSYARTHRAVEIEDFIRDNTFDFIKFKTNLLMDEAGADPIKRADLIKDILSSIALISDNIIRAVYIQECSMLLKMPEQELISMLNKKIRGKFESVHQVALKNKEVLEEQIGQDIPSVKSEVNHFEREIVRILLNYGDRNTTQIFIDQDGKECLLELKVADYIIQELESDELELENEMCKHIYEIFKLGSEKNSFPSFFTFTQDANKHVMEFVVDLCANGYDLSPHWQSKGIAIQTESDGLKLNELVREVVIAYKIEKIDELIRQIDEKLKIENSFDDLQSLLKEKDSYTKMKMERSVLLNRVILPNKHTNS